MSHTCIPLAQVLHELPLESGRIIMRALRRQVQVECVQRASTGLPKYVLIGRVGHANVQTSAHPRIGPPLVEELMGLLAPLIDLPATQADGAGFRSSERPGEVAASSP